MEVKRCTHSFRAKHGGMSVGDLVPAAHPLVKAYPQYFEDPADYVGRTYPQFVPAPEADEKKAERPTRKAAPARAPREK